MNGGGLQLQYVSPFHFQGSVGSLVTFVCQASDGVVAIVSLVYGSSTVSHEPFSIVIRAGTNTCSLALTGSREGLAGSIFERYGQQYNKLADFEYREGSVINFIVEGVL
jgi:hypothetical protein